MFNERQFIKYKKKIGYSVRKKLKSISNIIIKH